MLGHSGLSKTRLELRVLVGGALWILRNVISAVGTGGDISELWTCLFTSTSTSTSFRCGGKSRRLEVNRHSISVLRHTCLVHSCWFPVVMRKLHVFYPPGNRFMQVSPGGCLCHLTCSNIVLISPHTLCIIVLQKALVPANSIPLAPDQYQVFFHLLFAY